MDKDFPSNSISSRRSEYEESPSNNNLRPVISGKVRSRKKTMGRKFKDVFIGSDARSVGEYILNDILIPTIQYTLVDSVKRGVEMLIFGNTISDGRRSYGGYSRVSSLNDYNRYNDYSISSSSRRRDIDTTAARRRIQINKYKGSLDDDDLIFESVTDAKEVWSWLINLAEDYGRTSIADYYQLIGKSPEPSDFDYGWFKEDLKNLDIKRLIISCREGYLLDLPRTDFIK